MKPQRVNKKRDEYFAYGSVLEAVSQGLYPDRKHILREFVQNAHDALYDLRKQRSRMRLAPVEITASPPSLIIADKGIGMSKATMRRYRYLGFSPKEMGSHAGFRGIGKFSGISVCDRLIVRSSKLGDPKSYQVEIDASGMFARLKDEKNPPLEILLADHSKIEETDEDPEQHYTFVARVGATARTLTQYI
ncbi:MAG: ATP-binding protein [Acidobacteriota bacterium]